MVATFASQNLFWVQFPEHVGQCVWTFFPGCCTVVAHCFLTGPPFRHQTMGQMQRTNFPLKTIKCALTLIVIIDYIHNCCFSRITVLEHFLNINFCNVMTVLGCHNTLSFTSLYAIYKVYSFTQLLIFFLWIFYYICKIYNFGGGGNICCSSSLLQ